MISIHQVKVYTVVSNSPHWFTALEISSLADVAERTARHHALKLWEAEVFERKVLFDGYSYRIKSSPSIRAAQYVAEIEEAKRIYSDRIIA